MQEVGHQPAVRRLWFVAVPETRYAWNDGVALARLGRDLPAIPARTWGNAATGRKGIVTLIAAEWLQNRD